MATATVTTCDFCRQLVEAGKHFRVVVRRDREPCPSGNGYIPNNTERDICHPCAQKKLEPILQAEFAQA